jgi:hypothetical protein
MVSATSANVQMRDGLLKKQGTARSLRVSDKQVSSMPG